MTEELTSDDVFKAIQELLGDRQIRVFSYIYGYMSSDMNGGALTEFSNEIQKHRRLESTTKRDENDG